MSDNATNNKQEPERIKVSFLPSSNKLGGIILKYLLKTKMVTAMGMKSAWVTAGFPVELCYGFGIHPMHPENAACIAGSRKLENVPGKPPLSLKYIELAESMGYSRDLCSYFKSNIGAVSRNEDVFKGGIAKPTFMGSTNTICDTHVKWFQIQAREMGVPYFGFDVPSAVAGTDDARMNDYVEYLAGQFYDFFEFIKDVTGRKFVEKKFHAVLAKSDKLCELWKEIYKYRQDIPTPVAFQDTLASIFPMVLLPGLDVGIKYYEALLKDVKARVATQSGSLPRGKEKFRLLFEGIPMWYRIRFFHELVNYGAVVTYEPYTYSFGPRKRLGLSLDESLKDFARLMIDIPYNYSVEKRIEYFEKVIDDYKIDGVILHSNMSCRPSCTGMVDLKNAIQRDKGIPVWLMDCDQNDPRAFSEEQMKTRMESFVELLEQNKKK